MWQNPFRVVLSFEADTRFFALIGSDYQQSQMQAFNMRKNPLSHSRFCTSLAMLAVYAAVLSAGSQMARAQSGPASVMERARAAFEAMTEKGRKDIQNGLIWSGDYKGSVDGAFGRMTFNAIRGFEAAQGSNGDGILSRREREALTRIARQNIEQFGFRKIHERRSGISIGLPMKLLTRQSSLRNGLLYRSAAGNITVRTFQLDERRQSLNELYAQLRARKRGHRVTYKVIRDRFLVVSSETTKQLTYTRAARGSLQADGQQPGRTVVRGFTLTYSKSRRRSYDKLAIAISNSFDPFAAAPSSKPAGETVRDNGGAPRISDAQGAIVATAVAVAPNIFVSVIPTGCPARKIGNAPLTILAHDKSTGLTLLRAVSGKATHLPVPFLLTPSGQDYSVLFAEPGFAAGKVQISFARGKSQPAPSGVAQIRIAVPQRATGGLVLSVAGTPVGLLAATPTQRSANPDPNSSSNQEKLASTAPPPTRSFVPADQIRRMLDAAGISFPAQSVSARGSAIAFAAKYVRALAPVRCSPGAVR